MVENKKIVNPLYLKNYKLLYPDNMWKKSNLDHCYIVSINGKNEVAFGGNLCLENEKRSVPVIYILPIPSKNALGDKSFQEDYNVKYSYYAGGMAQAISSVEMVVALGKAGFMGTYGSGGMSLDEIERDIDKIKKELPDGPFIMNFLHIPNNDRLEFDLINTFIKKNIKVIEASAFIDLSPALLYYRISGLKKSSDGKIQITRRIIAKVSREEIASKFMSPPDVQIVNSLLKNNLITKEQAEMSAYVPLADDITVEADSGGHTDSRPLISLLPAMIKIRDDMQDKYNYHQKIRIGAAGGISTPAAAVGAFEMGASYVVTGSVNQACVEAGTSLYVKEVLSQVTMSDVVMAPCADMFELGAKVQVIKRGTMYPMNAQKLYDLYTKYKSIDEIPEADKNRIVKSYFKCTIEEVWEDVKKYFSKVDPRQISSAERNPRFKMALIFRWYLGNSSRWAILGTEDRKMDMQIWCGQSMGAFNNWVRGSYLESPENRHVSDIAEKIMTKASDLHFYNTLKRFGVDNYKSIELKKNNCLWDLNEIIEMTAVSMSKYLGPRYEKIDQYKTRARLPLPPFLFVSRITKIDAEFGKFKPSSIEFEFDVTRDCLFVASNRISHVVVSEASHVGIFLLAYMGFDELSNGTLSYRIVDTKSKFYGYLPELGETFRGVLEIKSFLKQGPTTLCIFTYKCYVDETPILVIDAIGGFFTERDLASSKGIGTIENSKISDVISNVKRVPIKFRSYKNSYTKDELEIFYNGQLEGSIYASHNGETKGIQIDKSIRQLDRIIYLSDSGGKYGIGEMIAEKDIDETYWAFDVHFLNDPVYPVSLIFEGVNQMFYFLIDMEIIAKRTDNIGPVLNRTTKGIFRGQIKPSKSTITYKMSFKEFNKKERLDVIFDADVYCNNVHIVKIEDCLVSIGINKEA